MNKKDNTMIKCMDFESVIAFLSTKNITKTDALLAMRALLTMINLDNENEDKYNIIYSSLCEQEKPSIISSR